MPSKAYLHELSDKEKKRFYSEEFLEGYSNMKVKLFFITLAIVVGDLVLAWIPSPFLSKSVALSAVNFVAPLAFLVYMISYSNCLQRKGYRFIRYRLILNTIAMIMFAGQCGFATYTRTSIALQTGLMSDWIAAQLLFVMSIHILPLVSLITPVWFLKVFIAGSYYMGLAIAYIKADYKLMYWIIIRCTVSFIFLTALTYFAWDFKYKQFISRIESEAWNKVYRDVLERSSKYVAVINSDGKITYSNSEFNRLTEDNYVAFFKKLKKIKVRNWTGDTLSTERTTGNNLDTQLNVEDDRLAPSIHSLSFKNVPTEYEDLESLLTLTRELLDKGSLQAKDQISFNAKLDTNPFTQTEAAYDGTLRPLLEYNKIVLIFFDVTERDRIVVLENNNEYKNQLLASISHELRTPLNCNLGLLQAAVNDVTISESIKANILLPAFRSGKLLSHLIDDILDYSHLQTSKLLLSFEAKSIKETLEYCYELLNSAFSVKNLTLNLFFDEKLPPLVKTDHMRVIQVVINLLSNALKFTEHGKVSLEAHAIEGNHIEIRVVDTGMGIKPEDIPKLFDENKMYKESEGRQKGRERYSKGAGLGLKVSNSLAKLLGLDDHEGIMVQSVRREGSVFSFKVRNISKQYEAMQLQKHSLTLEHRRSDMLLIPSTPDSMSPSLKEIPKERFIETEENDKKSVTDYSLNLKRTLSVINKKSKPSPAKRKHSVFFSNKILLVDDDPFNILALQSLLTQLGATTESVNNGKQAIDKVLENPNAYQLIFMDCQMPVMNGYEASFHLTQKMQEGEIPDIPIIGCTAFSAKDRIEECLNCGMKEVVNKPVMMKRLKEVFSKYIEE